MSAPGFNTRVPQGNRTIFPGTRRPGGRQTLRGGGRTRGRDIRQVPGHDRTGGGIFHTRPRQSHTVIVDSSPSHSYSVLHTSSTGRTSSVAALIVGVFLAILGACIFPADPLAGLLIGGLGLAIAGTAGTVYGVNYRT